MRQRMFLSQKQRGNSHLGMISLEHAFHGNHILRLLLDVQMVRFELHLLTLGFVAIFDLSDETDDCKSSHGESDM